MDQQSARHLHDQALVIDSHNDSIVAHMRRGHLSLDGSQTPRAAGALAFLRDAMPPSNKKIQLDLSLMRQAGLNAAFFAVDTTRAWNNHLLYGLDAMGFFMGELERQETNVVVVRQSADISRAHEQNKLAAVLAIENSNVLEQSTYVLPMLYRMGLRSMTLTHSARCWVGDGCEVENGGGLTQFGRTIVEQMNELGILVDISHINQRGFWDVLECTNAPLIASHSCCYHLCPHPRNLKDDQLRALAAAGGVVGITFVPTFIASQNPDLDALLDHLDHAVQVAGIDAVGLGSDFDGGGDLLADATHLSRLTEGLAARGYSEADLRKILGENHLRLLRDTIG